MKKFSLGTSVNDFSHFDIFFDFFRGHPSKDLSKVVSVFVRLVSNEKREYIRNFAGDAFAFLLRKQAASQPEKIEKFWAEISTEYESDEMALGHLGMLLFQVTRGVQNGFDSRGMNILKTVINLHINAVDVILTNFNKMMFGHLVRNQTKEFIEQILNCQKMERKVRMLLEMVKYKGQGSANYESQILR